MGSQLEVTVSSPLYPDCPATRRDAFDSLVGTTKGECQLQSQVLDARCPIPERWFDTFALGLVRRGVLIRQRVEMGGRATAIDAAGPGCVIPFQPSPSGPSVPTGYAATRVLLCLIPAEVLDAGCARHDGTALDLIRLQREAIERLERLADARGRSNVEERVAALLCALADTLSPPTTRTQIPADFQQRDMAALLGVRHETVCRVLRLFEDEGVIERGPLGIELRDRHGLETW